jgi:hypothetical protein
MEQLGASRLFSGIGASIDLLAIFAFFAVAFIYLLAPGAIKGKSRRPRRFVTSLYLFLGCLLVGFAERCYRYTLFSDHPSFSPFAGGSRTMSEIDVYTILGFTVVRTILLVAALVMVLKSLRSLGLPRQGQTQ